MSDRETLEGRWFALTRNAMPALAPTRGWPVRFDHCFQRILLDNACGQPWREVVDAPAYRNADAGLLERAIGLGEAVLAGKADLARLNDRSLKMRGKAGPAR